MMKKVIGVFLCLLITIVTVTGCSNNNEVKENSTVSKEKEEKINLDQESNESEKENHEEVVREKEIDETKIDDTEAQEYYDNLPLYKKKKSKKADGFLNPTFDITTSVTYSSGEDSDWSYGNQRKEFSLDTKTYARISSTAIANTSILRLNKGVNQEIKVIYKFTGIKSCMVKIADGNAKAYKTNDPDVMIVERTIYAQKKKKANEDIIILQYEPKEEGSMTVEVLYDDNVDKKFDVKNTIYFTK